MKALVLDFDGVIADSAPEALEVALATYTELRPGSALAARPRAALEAAFLELMPLGNRAEDYGAALAAIDADRALRDQAAYDAWRDGLDPAWLRAFHQGFYRVRADFAAREPERWNSLIQPYPAFAALLRRRAAEVELAIATAKDRSSVSRLLSTWGLADLFGPGRVLDKETGVSKVAHLEHLQHTLGVAFPELTFVDDKVNHLESVAPLGVRCALAAWGYNGPRERQRARELGFLVCGLDDAEALLFS
jgi:phosphoglycolate phosphatase-like HAD superfamily hydrolase